MTDYLALPPASELRGEVRVPPSKSATNRALVAAALTGSPVLIEGPLESDDTEALRACLAAMGARIETAETGWRVSGPLRRGPGDPPREIPLDARDSGTAARFLAAAAAATPGRFLLTGSARLCERPIGELVDALRAAGTTVSYRGAEGCLPIALENVGGAWRRPEIAVDASRSSQFLSALLLAGLAADGGLSVRASGAVASAPYVRMTIETLRALGHHVEEGETLRVRRAAADGVAERYAVPGDYSSAIPLLAAAGATGTAGGRLSLEGLRWPSGDADAGALPVLERMGLRLATSPGSVAVSADPRSLRPVSVAATDFPDAVPALAALSALAAGESRFSGIAHLRLKESDRIAALAALLEAAGARAVAEEDALTVVGPVRTMRRFAVLPTANDHRMAMAAAILALARPGILIENPGCVSKSYPGFFRDLESVAVRG
ncbi:MAG TPA: 3-phosphoshikimate 1-carboxyvinyltransferase [Thermoanaerobaculia bacterium]